MAYTNSVAPDPAEAIVVASYERVSKFAPGGFSLGAQEKDAAQFAAERRWLLPEDLRFVDGDTRNASGADWDLPGLNAMLAAAKQHRFSVLIVRDPDRFARNMTKALILEEQLRKHGVRVVFMLMPMEDTAEGRLLKNQLHAFAEYEREKIRFRTARGRREKAERGLVVGNCLAPYGYRYVRDDGPKPRVVGLELAPLEAPIVERIYREAASRSCEDIAAGLNRDGIPAPRARWRQTTVFDILYNPTYCGAYIYGLRSDSQRRLALLNGRSDVVIVPVPAIVSREKWVATQEALRRRLVVRKPRYAREDDPFLLRGMLTCGHCGGAISVSWNVMRTGSRTGPLVRYRRYLCLRSIPRLLPPGETPCPLRELKSDPTEDLLWRLVHEAMLDVDNLRRGLDLARRHHEHTSADQLERVRIVNREIAQQRARLKRIVEESLDAERGSETYRALAEKREATEALLRRLSAEAENMQAAPTPGLSDDQAAELEQMAAEVRAGLAVASEPEQGLTRRQVLEHLRLAVTVRLDPDGHLIGARNRFAFDPEAVIPLRTVGGSAHDEKETVLLTAPLGTLRLRLSPVA